MDELNYNGPYMIEMWHQPEDDDMANVSAAKRFIEDKFAERIRK